MYYQKIPKTFIEGFISQLAMAHNEMLQIALGSEVFGTITNRQWNKRHNWQTAWYGQFSLILTMRFFTTLCISSVYSTELWKNECFDMKRAFGLTFLHNTEVVNEYNNKESGQHAWDIYHNPADLFFFTTSSDGVKSFTHAVLFHILFKQDKKCKK